MLSFAMPPAAREVVARILKQTPGYTITHVRRHHEFDMHRPFKVPDVTESLYRGLRLAGPARMTERRRLAAIVFADVAEQAAHATLAAVANMWQR